MSPSNYGVPKSFHGPMGFLDFGRYLAHGGQVSKWPPFNKSGSVLQGHMSQYVNGETIGGIGRYQHRNLIQGEHLKGGLGLLRKQ
jgi:hypothetical protein